jgi:DNA-binding XRE family transcriptional regulator
MKISSFDKITIKEKGDYRLVPDKLLNLLLKPNDSSDSKIDFWVPPDSPITVGKLIKIQRNILGLSSDDLAKQVSISGAYLRQIESDSREPSKKIIASFCAIFGPKFLKSLNFLLDRKSAT